MIYVAPTGNSGADESAKAPLKNIDKALRVAKARDTIVVAAGNYARARCKTLDPRTYTYTPALG